MTKGSAGQQGFVHARPAAPADNKQAAQERHRLQDKLEDDEVFEALKVLHAEREAKTNTAS